MIIANLFTSHNIRLVISFTSFTPSELASPTLLNSNIHQNFPFALQGRVNPHFHSHQETNRKKMQSRFVTEKRVTLSTMGGHTPLDDIHNEVLPLTLQSEIKQHQIISLIKGNC